MSRSQFENYYGVDLSTDAGKWQAAKAMAQRPTENVIRQFAGAMGAVFMGMGGNTAYLITVLKPAVYDSHGNRLADQVNGVVNLSIGVGRSELVIDQQGVQAVFGFPEIQGSTELAIAALKPTFDRAAHFARSQGGRGQVPLYLIKNVFKSPLLENNKALYIGRVNSSTALGTANTLGKLAPALTGLGIITNGYDIVKDGQLTAGDGFQALNTGLMIAFPVYGVAYGVLDLGFSVFTDQSLTDRIKTGIDSNVSGSVAIPGF